MIPFGTKDTPDHTITDGNRRIMFRNGVFRAVNGEELSLLLANGSVFPLFPDSNGMEIDSLIKGLPKDMLKRWLLLLGLETAGKKMELRERLVEFYRNSKRSDKGDSNS